MVRKVRELANFAYHSKKKKYWGICLEELEKEEKVSLYPGWQHTRTPRLQRAGVPW